jgi:hypothetical protein
MIGLVVRQIQLRWRHLTQELLNERIVDRGQKQAFVAQDAPWLGFVIAVGIGLKGRGFSNVGQQCRLSLKDPSRQLDDMLPSGWLDYLGQARLHRRLDQLHGGRGRECR